MPIGEKSAQSYGWGITLSAPVKDGEGIKIPTPGIDLRYTDTAHAEVSVISTNKVFKPDDGEVDVAFDMTAGAETVDVNNHTGLEWPLGDQVYVYCPHLLAEGNNEWDLKGQIWDLQQRVSALEGVTLQQTQKHKPPPEPKDDDENTSTAKRTPRHK
jgi:hypothetical protein